MEERKMNEKNLTDIFNSPKIVCKMEGHNDSPKTFGAVNFTAQPESGVVHFVVKTSHGLKAKTVPLSRIIWIDDYTVDDDNGEEKHG